MKVEEQVRRGLLDIVHMGLDCLTFSAVSTGKYRTHVFLCGRRDVSEDVALTIAAHTILPDWTLR